MDSTTKTTYSLQLCSAGRWFDVNANIDVTAQDVAEWGWGTPGFYHSNSHNVEVVRAYYRNVLGNRKGYRIVEKVSTWNTVEL